MEQSATLPFILPELIIEPGSLSPMEKSLLAHHIMLIRPSTIVELGVYKATTTIFIGSLVELNSIDCHIFGFDRAQTVDDLRKTNEEVKRLEAKGILSLVPGDLPDSLVNWLKITKRQVDFALVDATHRYWAVYGELKLLWPSLSEDGLILCHDYTGEEFEGVRYAVNRFSARHHTLVMPLTSSRQAAQAGNLSVLVALRRPQVTHSMKAKINFQAQAARVKLAKNRFLKALWKKYRKRTISMKQAIRE